MSVAALLARAVERHGDREAWREGGVAASYRDLAARALRLADELAASGLAAGDRCSILADNGPLYLTSYFAAARAGLVLNPLGLRLALAELAAILRDAGTRVLLTDRANLELAHRAAEEAGLDEVLLLELRHAPDASDSRASLALDDARADDPAHLYYTSGTTGRAKGVVLTNRNVVRHAELAVSELGLGPDDVWGHFAPLFHLADAWACFAVTAVGGRHAFVPRFEAGAVLDSIATEGVTATNLVPTMVVRCLAEQERSRRRLDSLRLVLSGGAPIAPAVVRELLDSFGCEYAQTYGLTETSPYLTTSRLGPAERALDPAARLAKLGRTGRPLKGVDVEVVRPDGTPVRRDDSEVGEVRARGDTVSPGYWRRPEETAEVFREGWFYTGDLAVVDADGWLTVVDRRKDVILTGGETVYSTEVERCLFEHSAVREAAAFGVPDREWGERIEAAVVARDGAALDGEDLRRHCRDRIAAYKVPRRFHVLDDLPRTGSGKVRKRALRERFAATS